MNKYLCIILGHNYVMPLIILGDIENIIRPLCWESKDNNYIYNLFLLTDKDYYISKGVIHRGRFFKDEGGRVDGIRICR